MEQPTCPVSTSSPICAARTRRSLTAGTRNQTRPARRHPMTSLADPPGRMNSPADAAAALRARLTGKVLLPGQPAWEEVVTGFNAAVIHAPAMVVAAADASDVQAAVRYCAAAGLPVRAQATGHGANTRMEGGVLINTRRLDRVSIDQGARTATVGAGTRWRQVID